MPRPERNVTKIVSFKNSYTLVSDCLLSRAREECSDFPLNYHMTVTFLEVNFIF